MAEENQSTDLIISYVVSPEGTPSPAQLELKSVMSQGYRVVDVIQTPMPMVAGAGYGTYRTGSICVTVVLTNGIKASLRYSRPKDD